MHTFVNDYSRHRPWLRTTGFGVIHKQGSEAALHRLRHHQDRRGRPAGAPEGDPGRRGRSGRGFTYPDCAAIEQVFVNVNPQSTLLLGQARGAAICALVSAQTERGRIFADAGQAGGGGHRPAVKAQVQDMVARLLSLPGLPGTDAADALGIAICHAHSRETLALIAGAGKHDDGRPRSAGLRMKNGRLVG
jgi:crossover junction endodeoxyribonuclease RuvC